MLSRMGLLDRARATGLRQRGIAGVSQRAISARWMSTRLMASRPLRGLTRRRFFSKAGAIDLPQYAQAAVR